MAAAAAEPSVLERRRKAQIMRAVIQAVAEDGIDGATMRGIADRAGVSTGMLTYYYRSKADLVRETIRNAYRGFTTSLDAEVGESHSPERVQRFFANILRASSDGSLPAKFWLDYWAHAARDPSLKNPLDGEPPRAREVFRLGIAAGVAGGELRSDLDVERCADLLNLAYYGARVQLGLQDTTLEDIEAAVACAMRLMQKQP